jgi:hypothetical protein
MRLVFLWILFLTVLSLAPLGIKYHLHTTGHLHDWGHFFAFLITAMVFTRVSMRPRFLGLLGTILLGAILEKLEVMAYHSHYEWMDVGMDTLGALCGFLIMMFTPGFDNDSDPSATSEDA